MRAPVLKAWVRNNTRRLYTMPEPRDYAAAVALLNTLQSNFATVNALKKSRKVDNLRSIPEMNDFFHRIDYSPEWFASLRPIHIAGTKGKGSTSSFVSSILAQYSPNNIRKVGLYTSPHLRFVRERIQINNSPLSEEKFARYFFEVWDKLSQSGNGDKPMYFRYLTLMAMHTFVKEGIDTAVIECGIGGEYDSTNVITHPTVAAITSLGLDHVGILGTTIEEIAWHKAGVFKSGASALTVPQPSSAMEVLHQRANEKGVGLEVVDVHPEIKSGKAPLGLLGEFQKLNASLAVAIAANHLHKIGVFDTLQQDNIKGSALPDEFLRGLQDVKLRGRCEIIEDAKHPIKWHLDGGHTVESLTLVGRWFADTVREPHNESGDQEGGSTPRVLIFNQQASERNPAELLRTLFAAVTESSSDKRPFTHVVFTTNVTFKNSGYRPDLVAVNANTTDIEHLKVQHDLTSAWSKLDPETRVEVTSTIEEAVDYVERVSQSTPSSRAMTSVLITGSLHLVGGALEVLEQGNPA